MKPTLTRSETPPRIQWAPLDALGQIEFPIIFGEGTAAQTKVIIFDVVDVCYAYNAILG